jgi:hemerythrin-like metal-binding protein
MPLIVWNDHYSVKIDKIDQQHQKLISLLNTLHEAMLSGKGKEKLELILKELVEYTEYHFKTEEEIFVQYSYKDKVAHIKEHNILREKVLNYYNKMKTGEIVVSHDILKLLKEWLNNHILSVDKKYSLELSSKIK